MGEFMFGVTRGKLTKAEQKRRERIATKHGCGWIYINDPGDGWKGWFTGPNLGHPFDKGLEHDVAEDLKLEEE